MQFNIIAKHWCNLFRFILIHVFLSIVQKGWPHGHSPFVLFLPYVWLSTQRRDLSAIYQLLFRIRCHIKFWLDQMLSFSFLHSPGGKQYRNSIMDTEVKATHQKPGLLETKKKRVSQHHAETQSIDVHRAQLFSQSINGFQSTFFNILTVLSNHVRTTCNSSFLFMNWLE